MTDERICALRAHLIENGYPTAYSDIIEQNYDFATYEVGSEMYLVLDEDEATEQATNDILDTLWAFNAGFIIDHTNLPYDAMLMVQSYQSEQCEHANETILALITDIDAFVDDAICADGRGQFMNTYDGNEYESGDYFIYRIE